jgi:hypothetical protein
MEPSEHLEKQNKEFSRWIEDTCRTCKHRRLFHLWDSDGSVKTPPLGGKGYVHGNCNFATVDGFCKCSEWMSPDNLEYIELLAKRKGLISEEEKDNP